MNFLKIGLTTTISFILGAMLSHAPTAKANPSEQKYAQVNAHVFVVPVWMVDEKTPQTADLPGNRIAGISCIPHPTDKMPNAAVCYVATSLN